MLEFNGKQGVLGLALMLASALVWGEEIVPGLWEMQFELAPEQQAQLAEAQKQLQKLPPSQRQMMEQMMASQGLSLSRPNAIRTCVTPEQAKSRQIQVDPDEGDCQQEVLKQTASQMKMAFNCPDSEGTATVDFDGGKSYTTRIKGVRKQGGKREPINHTLRARWLQADCGETPSR